jgi:hypothetical protein
MVYMSEGRKTMEKKNEEEEPCKNGEAWLSRNPTKMETS